jgi:hypothetical protein
MDRDARIDRIKTNGIPGVPYLECEKVLFYTNQFR